MKLEIVRINEINISEKNKVDKFILDVNTNGEFITTIEYLEYHPVDRFIDKSIIIKDLDSGSIKCVMMAASTKENKDIIVSHPGTTFSGLIFNRKTKVCEIEEMLEVIETYYRDQCVKIIFKNIPSCYCSQPNDDTGYALMKKNYMYGYTALANIIDLTNIKNEVEIFEIYTSKRRNQVKKPIKKNEFELAKLETIDEIIWKNMNQNLSDKYDTRTTHTFAEISELQKKISEKYYSLCSKIK